VVLSGALDDGAAGAAGIAAQDGVVVVQDPQEARVASMPRAALASVRRAHAVPASGLAPLLTSLVTKAPPPDRPPVDELLKWEGRNVDSETVNAGRPPGSPVAVGCPECGGGMFQTTDPGRVHYLCHVGHSWSPETLVDAQQEASEAALYTAASKLIEEAAVLRAVAAARRDEAASDDFADFEERARRAEQRAEEIQRMLRGGG
jgi:two-component system chemotaxis response regulator CheB